MKTITAEEFDRKFDDGEDISEYIDLENGFRPNQLQHIGLDLPGWLLFSLDYEAKRLGVTRESLMQRFLEERMRPSRAG